jgi:integrase
MATPVRGRPTAATSIFCHPAGNWIRPDVVTKGTRRLARKAGLKGVSLHTIRHSHGSQLLSLGVPCRPYPNGLDIPV